jgi:hypothetical protein
MERMRPKRASIDIRRPPRVAVVISLVGPKVAGFAINPYLPLPYHLLDVAAPER